MKKSKFDLSHLHSTTLEMGKLVPFYLEDCLPNDTFRISMRSIIRAQPMIAPLMHEVRLFTQYFFVPYRLLWDEWIPFITGGESGSEAPAYPVVKAPADKGWQVGSLADYFGFPVNQPEVVVSAMPFRAMAKIWNDHYLKDDIDTEVPWASTSGDDTVTSQDLLNCHWSRDRFTEAKPNTQRGAQVAVPVNSLEGVSQIKISALGTLTGFTWHKKVQVYSFAYVDFYMYLTSVKIPASLFEGLVFSGDSIKLSHTFYLEKTGKQSVTMSNGIVLNFTTKSNGRWDYDEKVISNPAVNVSFEIKITDKKSAVTGDVADVTFESGKPIRAIFKSFSYQSSVNVRDLRTASALQRVQEASMKYGSNYEDYVQHEFKMRPRDSRLQKSEYIGGGSSILQISEVLQTSEGTNSGVGSMAGHGIASLNQRRIRFRVPEHGCIIGLMSIRPATVYTQGIERAWLKRTRWEFFTKELADIGAQEILQQELYANKDNASIVFGYDLNGNYREYRNRKPMVTGNFRSDLNFWNLARFFNSAPVLNADFCKMNPSKRPFAITDQTLPAFICMLKNIVYAYRPIPKSSRGRLV